MTQTEVAFTSAYKEFFEAYHEAGFRQPDGCGDAQLVRALSGICLPGEYPTADGIPGVDPDTASYFRNEVTPAMRRPSATERPAVLLVAQLLGSVRAAGDSNDPTLSAPTEFAIEHGSLTVDAHEESVAFNNGHVLEYGMGLIGLNTHVRNLQRGVYSLSSVEADELETSVIAGYAAHYELDATQITNLGCGFKDGVDQLLADESYVPADVLIASLVQAAGRELLYGIKHAPQLLRAGGMLIARVPTIRQPGQAISYSRLEAAVTGDTRLQVSTSKRIQKSAPPQASRRIGLPQEHVLIIATNGAA